MRRLVALQPWWAATVPIVALAVLGGTWRLAPNGLWLTLVGIALIAAVLTAVHHAEVVAHKVGEPFGTLVLALAVTVIELGLIGSMMASGKAGASSLARDTVFATVMIILNGVIGLCMLIGAARHHVLRFQVDGTSSELAVLAAMTVLTLVLPTFTITVTGPVYTGPQLAFAGVASLVLYGVFVFSQTIRHRQDFIPILLDETADEHEPPSAGTSWTSLLLLLLSLIAVIGLAKKLSPSIEQVVKASAAPDAITGVVIAMLVLLPETWAAIRAALRNRAQTSLNLALGSALATIGLTIPAVALLATILGIPLELGLSATQIVLLSLSLLVATLTLANGRATVLHGTVHLVLFGAFLFLAIIP